MKLFEAAEFSGFAEVAYADRAKGGLAKAVFDKKGVLLTPADLGLSSADFTSGYYSKGSVGVGAAAAFAAVKDGRLIISVRGSDEIPLDLFDGYLSLWQEGHFLRLRPFFEACANYAIKHGFDVVATGHSLGGAMATMLAQSDIASKLKAASVDLTVFTLASPGTVSKAPVSASDVIHFGVQQDDIFGEAWLVGPKVYYPGKTVTVTSAELGLVNLKTQHTTETFNILPRYAAALGQLPFVAKHWADYDLESLKLYVSPETVKPPSGTWAISAASGANRGIFLGSKHADEFAAGSRGDLLLGLGGNDILRGGSGSDYLFGGEGVDQLYAGDGVDNWLYGEAGNDTLTGGAGRDTLVGGAGVDKLFAGEGAFNALHGDDGNDILVGGGGSDTIMGGLGADRIETGASTQTNDLVWAGDGNDTILVGAGNLGQRQLHGEAGDDLIRGADGRDYMWGEDHADRLWGYGANDFLWGGAGDDVIYGGGDRDTIYGESDNDTLYGDAGDDFIFGGDGNDAITGGAGVDHLNGEGGADTYFAKDGVSDKIILQFYLLGGKKVYVDTIGSADAIDRLEEEKVDPPLFL